MTREISPINEIALGLVVATTEHAAAIGHDGDPAAYASSGTNLIAVYRAEHGADNGKVAADIAHQALKLINIARGQAYDLLAAEMRVLPSMDKMQVASVLTMGHSIGSRFGAVSREPYYAEETTNDDYLLGRICADPRQYMRYDGSREVVWTERGNELLRPSIARRAGCPALGQSVPLANGSKAELFNLFWQRFTADFIRPYVLFGLPYRSTPAL